MRKLEKPELYRAIWVNSHYVVDYVNHLIEHFPDPIFSQAYRERQTFPQFYAAATSLPKEQTL